MLKVEYIKVGDNNYKKTYSDENYLIINTKTNLLYTEAIDLMYNNNVYEETDILANDETVEEEVSEE